MEDKIIVKSIGFVELLQIVFIVLKLCEVITWSWIWIFTPTWINFLFIIVIILYYMANA